MRRASAGPRAQRSRAPVLLAPLTEQFAYAQFCLVELRLGISYRAVEQFRNFLVLVSFHFVQQENSTVAVRELFDRPRQSDTIDAACQAIITAAIFASNHFCILVIRFVE